MKKTDHCGNRAHANTIINSVPAMLVMAVVAICLGIFFIVSQNNNKPIERREAISYSGTFEKYETSKNYCMIYFEDGSQFNVYPHTQTSEFRQTMMSINKGTTLHILVNPNNDCVIEIKNDTEEILNFELSQEAIDAYDDGYIIMGYFVCIAGIFLIVYAVCSVNFKRKEHARHAKRIKLENNGFKSLVIRNADPDVKNKVLAKASVKGYTIFYRRVKSSNELVINGKVYDEMKGIIEFEHKLCARVEGHSVEAGTDENCCSYIMFDGEIIACKKRLI